MRDAVEGAQLRRPVGGGAGGQVDLLVPFEHGGCGAQVEGLAEQAAKGVDGSSHVVSFVSSPEAWSLARGSYSTRPRVGSPRSAARTS